MRLTVLFMNLLLLTGSAAQADNIELNFSVDSLSISSSAYHYSYPNTKILTVNPLLSIPVKTLYLEVPSNISDLMINVESSNQIYIGSITENDSYFSDAITAAENGNKVSLLKKKSDLARSLYDKQIMRKNGDRYLTVSILPVIIDSNNNIFLNSSITITTNFSTQQIFDIRQFSEVISDNQIYYTPVLSQKIGGNNSGQTKFVIITSSELAAAFQELADFRNVSGIPTSIVIIDSIISNYSGLDDQEKIRNYLKDFYNDGGEYVLLGGNDAVIPARYLYYYNTSSPPSDPYNLMPSDLYYADLDGDWDVDRDGVWGEPTQDSPDIVPELIVGRLPVDKIEAVENYISKIILYQTNPGNGQADYLEKTLIFSSDQMRDYPTMGQHGYIAAEYPSFVEIDTSQTIEMPDGYDSNPTNPDGAFGIQKISDGFGLIHILAHGRTDGFRVKAGYYGGVSSSLILTSPQLGGNGSIEDLEPNGKVSLYYSLSCQVGGYDLDSTNGEKSDWSFVEKIISADSAGAFGMVAYSRWGWVYSSYFLETSYVNHLYNEAGGNPIRAMYLSWLDYPYYRDLIYGQNYFGDPTVTYYRTIPAILQLDLSDSKGVEQITTTINGAPLSDANVVVSLGGVIIEEGLTDKNGKYNLSTELNYGTEYCFTAYKDGCTIAHKFYSPSIILDNDNDVSEQLPTEYYLEQNFPNPFNPSTTIRYNLPKVSDVTLDIFNILGQTVNSVSFTNQPVGEYSYVWNGLDEYGRPLSSGLYFYRLRAGDFIETRKMSLIK